MLPQLPTIPGNGVGGTVSALGSGVRRGPIRTRVLATTGGTGGYAELASTPADGLIPIPDGVEWADAVAILADGRTAIALIDRAAIVPGETVLVEAAAGGVGSLLVQLAKRAGGLVIAAVGGGRKLGVARSLGADIVVDYRGESWGDEVASAIGGAKVDVVFDGVGGSIGREAFALLGAGGRLCTFGMASGAFATVTDEELQDRDVTQVRGAVADQDQMRALTERALSTVGAGQLRPLIGQRVPLARAAEAHRTIEARATIGKTLLVCRGA